MSDKAPFLVTLVLAIIGWAVTHIVNELTEAPTLELRSVTASNASSKILTLRLTNLTRDKVFRGLNLVVTVPEGETLNSFEVTPVEPADEGDAPTTRAGRSGSFIFPELQPGGALYAEAAYSGNGQPSVRIQLTSGAVRIVAPSIETFMIRHEIGILVFLTLFGMSALLALQIVNLSRYRLGNAHGDDVRERDW